RPVTSRPSAPGTITPCALAMSSSRRNRRPPQTCGNEQRIKILLVCIRPRRHAEKWPQARNDAPDGRRHHPPGGREAIGSLGRFGLIDHKENDIARIVDRKGTGKGSNTLVQLVTA